MIDTDKIMRTTKILLHGRHINKNEADDYLELIAEVLRLREGIRQIIEHNEGVDVDMFGPQVSDKLKGLIE